MNDKSKRYSHIKNDKSLIDGIPNEEDLVKFEEWKKNVKRDRLRTCISYGILMGFSAFIMLLMVLSFCTKLSEYIFFWALILGLFIWGGIKCIEEYMKPQSWKIDYCKNGKVIDKYIVHINKGLNNYYIITSINEILFKIRTETGRKYSLNYDLLEIGDEVIVFSIEGYGLDVMKK